MEIKEDNEDLAKLLEDAYKNRLIQNKIDDEKIIKGNNKVMEIFADDENFSKVSKYMPFYNLDSKQILDENKKRKIKDSDCCICYTDLKDTFTVTTKCNHNLCFDCITKLKKMSCPLCRTDFPQEICKKIDFINDSKRMVNFNVEGIDSSFSWSGTPAAFNPTIHYSTFNN